MKLTKEAESEALNDKDVDFEANSEADTDWLRDETTQRSLRSLT